MNKRGIETLVGGFVVLGLAGLLFVALKAANLTTFGGSTGYVVTAKFDNIGGLKPRSPIRSAGVTIGRAQLEVNRWSLEMGGHCRTGLEDNVRMDRTTLAPSNAALVARLAALTSEYGRRPATAAEARALLGLRTVV